MIASAFGNWFTVATGTCANACFACLCADLPEHLVRTAPALGERHLRAVARRPLHRLGHAVDVAVHAVENDLNADRHHRLLCMVVADTIREAGAGANGQKPRGSAILVGLRGGRVQSWRNIRAASSRASRRTGSSTRRASSPAAPTSIRAHEYDRLYRESIDQPGRLLGPGGGGAALVQAVGQGAGLEARRTRSGSSAARRTSRTTASTGRSSSAAATRSRSSGKASPRAADPAAADDPQDHLPAAPRRRLPLRQRPEEARREQRRPRHHLHADGPRGRRRHARLRADRRAALGHLRRLLAARRSSTASRTPRATSSSPPTAAAAAAQVVPLKNNVDEALKKTDLVKKVVVLKRTGRRPSPMSRRARDIWWHELIASSRTDCPAEPMDSEDLLFVLYTSGSTGKPKGIIHTTGGYMVGTYLTTKYVFDLHDERHLLVHRRRRLDHRPQLRRLRPAEPTARRSSCTKARPTSPTSAASGR